MRRHLVSVLDLDNSVRFGRDTWDRVEEAARYMPSTKGWNQPRRALTYARQTELICISLNDVNTSDWTIKHSVLRLMVKSGCWWSLSGSNRRPSACKADALPAELRPRRDVVGRGGLEPPTSRLSGVRSNHLSYRPSPDR